MTHEMLLREIGELEGEGLDGTFRIRRTVLATMHGNALEQFREALQGYCKDQGLDVFFVQEVDLMTDEVVFRWFPNLSAEEAAAQKFIEMVPEWISKLITMDGRRYLPGYIHVPEGLAEYIDGDKLKEAIKPVCEAHPNLEIVYWKTAAVKDIPLGGIISWKQQYPYVIALDELGTEAQIVKQEENSGELSEDESEGRTT